MDKENTKFKLLELTNFDKKINLTLIGLDGNAFVLLSAFTFQAKKEGWSKEEIDYVRYKAMSSDYSHLLNVLSDHCHDASGEESEEIIYKNGRTYKAIN